MTATAEPAVASPVPGGGGVLGVVLAGGRSSRMGRDKARLRLDGRTLLRRALRLLATRCSEVMVSGRAVPGLVSIPDLHPGLGPTGGIASARAWARRHAAPGEAPLLLFVPLDMPGLRPEDLDRLLAALGPADAAHFAGHPLPLLLRAGARPLPDPGPAQGGKAPSIRAWLGGLDVVVLDPAGADLDNVNTPEQWARVRGVAPPDGAADPAQTGSTDS